MAKRILVYDNCFPSARNLREALKQYTDEKVLITSNPKYVTGRRLLVRYGNSTPIPGLETGYNSADFVRLSSNKLEFARLMNENNILSPMYFKGTPNRYPVVIRRLLNGMGGRGIYVAENEQEFRDLWHPNFYWSAWYPTQFEIRVHVFLPNGGGVIIPRIFRKVGEDGKYPIRTNDEYAYKLKNKDRYAKAIDAVHRIAGLMRDAGGKFFALDMGWSTDLKDYVIFESNSAPGINENTAEEYARFLHNEGLV